MGMQKPFGVKVKFSIRGEQYCLTDKQWCFRGCSCQWRSADTTYMDHRLRFQNKSRIEIVSFYHRMNIMHKLCEVVLLASVVMINGKQCGEILPKNTVLIYLLDFILP